MIARDLSGRDARHFKMHKCSGNYSHEAVLNILDRLTGYQVFAGYVSLFLARQEEVDEDFALLNPDKVERRLRASANFVNGSAQCDYLRFVKTNLGPLLREGYLVSDSFFEFAGQYNESKGRLVIGIDNFKRNSTRVVSPLDTNWSIDIGQIPNRVLKVQLEEVLRKSRLHQETSYTNYFKR
jgi:hypothetical protein